MSLVLSCLAFCAPNLLDAQDAPVLLDQKAQAIDSVTLTSDQDEVRIAYRAGQATTICVSSADPGAKGHNRVGRYRPGPRAQQLLGRLAPLKAQRSLGLLDDTHLQSFGLKEPSLNRLRITAGTEVLELSLGRALYGSGDLYALVPDRGVFVISSLLVRDLDRLGAALWETHLIDPQRGTAQKLTVTQNGRSRTLERGEEASPSDRLAHRLLQQSTALELYTAAAQAPQGEPILTLELGGAAQSDGPPAFLRLYREGVDVVATSSDQPGPMKVPNADAAALEETAAAVLAEP
jgi:hypothetical protein